MTTARDVTTTPARPPLPGHRPPLAGDDAAAYDGLLLQAMDLVKPADLFDEAWLRDVVDLLGFPARSLARAPRMTANGSFHNQI